MVLWVGSSANVVWFTEEVAALVIDNGYVFGDGSRGHVALRPPLHSRVFYRLERVGGIQVQRSKTRELHMLREEMLTCLVRVCARPVLPVMMHPGLFSVSFAAPPSLLCIIRVVCVF